MKCHSTPTWAGKPAQVIGALYWLGGSQRFLCVGCRDSAIGRAENGRISLKAMAESTSREMLASRSNIS
jgi:hypothetical protein